MEPLEPSESAAATEAERFVDRYLDAFNRHSPTEMGALVHREVEVFYVDGQGVSGLGTKGRDQLVTELTGYFGQLPDVASSAGDVVATGNGFISYVETVRWTAGERERSQSSLTVLEVDDDQLRRAWYFPASANGG